MIKLVILYWGLTMLVTGIAGLLEREGGKNGKEKKHF